MIVFFRLLTFMRPREHVIHPAGQLPLPVAQFLRLRDQIPWLYGLLATNSVILAYTHRAVAPTTLTITVPAVLILATLVRMAMWLTPIRAEDLAVAKVEAKLRSAVAVAVALAIGFVTWALGLDQYGNAWEHGHVAIYVAVTVLGCIFCLNYLPLAATLVGVTVIGTFLVYALLQQTEILIAIAINIGLVAAMILKLLNDSYHGFVDLELAQRDLHRKRRQAQALGTENARLAETDALTGLPNRRFFFAMLDSMIEQASADHSFCVGLIDLDRFKPINDTHGHAQGDRLLQIIGERLQSSRPDDVIVARLGGDEFGLIINGGADKAEAIANSLCTAVRAPVRLGDLGVSVGCSAGLVVFPQAGTTAHALYDRADFALYHAKNQKRGQCVRFSGELENLIRTEQALEAALQGADLQTELRLAFQPIVYTDTLEVVSVEGLARWTSPRLGVVSPEQLIQTAERVGRAREVTLTLFDKALVSLARLPANVRLSFNLSGIDLGDPGTIEALLSRIGQEHHLAHRLVFEITESSLIAEIEAAEVALRRLRAVGAQIALDDFGTGYSSLSSLHMLPLDIVKIDRSFATRLDEPSGRRLIAAIRNLARALSLDCVIEGIETESQLIGARLGGFTLAQGYYMHRPLEMADILRLLAPAPTASPHPRNRFG
ncbi:putative bifunctional diguanylate cyclase/phosphodiesterase [Novosphingobium sp. 9]|uniref:putative bifunctional diguanylate cyclase/phosphodiesterase n=1 Tax=Novosphingobium sp. 9 TaxID=2025349 RepID=UPI0021B5CD6B|nr:EAL domain-containing protein [Novosphingobium sp. 9]